MITTAQLSRQIGISQRIIQNRILRLGLKVQRAGNVFILTQSQAEAIRTYVDNRTKESRKQ